MFKKATMRKFRHEQTIDDASTKEALYGMFKDIEDILVSDGVSRRSGPFEATFDELMPLRDRIIGRLAGWDAYGDAFQDARKGADKVY